MEDGKKICKKCGESLEEGARFCTQCGEPVEAAQSLINTEEQKANSALQDAESAQVKDAAQEVRKDGYKKNGIIMNSEAPFQNAMEPLDVGYYILGGIGLVVGIILAGLNGAVVSALLALLVWWVIKANIALAKWRNLCFCEFYTDRQPAPEELLGRLASALTPYGLRVDSNKGMPAVSYRNVKIKVEYNENGTFSLPWSQNPGFFFFDRRYITSYLNTVAVMSIVAYQIQKVSSNAAVNNDPVNPNNVVVQPIQLLHPKLTNKRMLQIAGIGILAIIMIVGLATNFGGNKYVELVKNGTPISASAYSDVTYGEAFKNYFESPKWTDFKSEDGENIVEFTGKCMYQDTKVDALLQFTISDDVKAFTATYLSFNDISQNDLMIGILISDVFDEYSNSKSD